MIMTEIDQSTQDQRQYKTQSQKYHFGNSQIQNFVNKSVTFALFPPLHLKSKFYHKSNKCQSDKNYEPGHLYRSQTLT